MGATPTQYAGATIENNTSSKVNGYTPVYGDQNSGPVVDSSQNGLDKNGGGTPPANPPTGGNQQGPYVDPDGNKYPEGYHSGGIDGYYGKATNPNEDLLAEGAGNPSWADAVQNAGSTALDLTNVQYQDVYDDLLNRSGLDLDGDVDVGRVDRIDTTKEEEMLRQLTEAQKEQAINKADYAVDTGTRDLQRQMENAQAQFQSQRDQIDIDERRALDNQVLYAEARGDRGGIGQAQYNTIQNTAATNRLTVQKEQTKLATDTARQIADLRAQGEFEKANQLLSITQNYLSELMNLYQWAKEANIGIDEFNLQVEQWEENYGLSLLGAQIDLANATGVFANGTLTPEAEERRRAMLAASGQALMESGVAPSMEQLRAMGMNEVQAAQYLQRAFPEGAVVVPGQENLKNYIPSNAPTQTNTGESAKYSGLSNKDFINKAYVDYLGYNPDSEGLRYWMNQLNDNALNRDQVIENLKAAEVNDYVNRLYRSTFNRNADTEGLNYWSGLIRTGQLNRDQVRSLISTSPEAGSNRV